MNQQMVLPEGGLASFISSNMDEFDDSRLAFGRQGGINSMRDTAERMAQMGRNGDVHIAHLQQGEGIVPREVLQNNPELAQNIGYAISAEGADPSAYIVGSESNSINPYTGQREFFLKKLVSGVKNILKAVAPIVIPMALNFFAPGLGTMASGFIGGGIGALAQGANFKDSIKMGLIGGAIGGITSGLQGGFSKGEGTFMQKFGQGFKDTALPSGEIFRAGSAGDRGIFTKSQAESVAPVNPKVVDPIQQGVVESDPSMFEKFMGKTKDTFYEAPVTAEQARANVLSNPKITASSPSFAELVAQETTKGGIKMLPTAIATLGVGALAGGFDEEGNAPIEDPYSGPSMSEERLAANPELYRTGVASQPNYITMAETMVNPRELDLRPYYEQYLNPVAAASGGEMNFPRRNGYIGGPGTETSDDIPAMLSDGEFVMTAQAVRGLGNGSRKQGVRKMYDMMRAFEGGVVA